MILSNDGNTTAILLVKGCSNFFILLNPAVAPCLFTVRKLYLALWRRKISFDVQLSKDLLAKTSALDLSTLH